MQHNKLQNFKFYCPYHEHGDPSIKVLSQRLQNIKFAMESPFTQPNYANLKKETHTNDVSPLTITRWMVHIILVLNQPISYSQFIKEGVEISNAGFIKKFNRNY